MPYKFERLEVWQLSLEYAEQARFLGLALRSLVETVACQHLIQRRGYLSEGKLQSEAYLFSERLFAKLAAFRRSLQPDALREDSVTYDADDDR